MGDREHRAESREQRDPVKGSLSKLLAPSSELIGMKKPELLAPAGSPEKLDYAIAYGADAVYLSGRQYGLRQAAQNFSLDEIDKAVKSTHEAQKKVYVAVNAFVRNADLDGITAYLKQLRSLGVDAVIVSDPGVLNLVLQQAPELPLHLSTQANTLNSKSIDFWVKAGVKRVTLARELSCDEMRVLAATASCEVEVFVHGAMCIAYSGRCLLSKYLADRDANSGDCAQACRWKYFLMEERRPGTFFPIEDDGSGAYIFNSRDLCLLEYLPKLVEFGVDSIKIEGRTKSLHYLAAVTKVYREAIDTLFSRPSRFPELVNDWRSELEKVSHRPYSPGFFCGERSLQEVVSGSPASSHLFVGVVDDREENDLYRIRVKNRLRVGEEIEILQPHRSSLKSRVREMMDCGTELQMREAHANSEVRMSMEENIEKYSILRRKIAVE
jgi:putative protease